MSPLKTDKNGETWLSMDWQCIICKENKTEARLFGGDLVASSPSKDGIRRGICSECGDKLMGSQPRREIDSIKTRLIVERELPPSLQRIKQFEGTPGWWLKKSS
ncbi:MAG: hypothetical protein Q8N59_03610 [bacterium]|nr:hypothetical protein [bacterium]